MRGVKAEQQPDDRTVCVVIPRHVQVPELVHTNRVEGDTEEQAHHHPQAHAGEIDTLAGAFRQLVGNHARKEDQSIDGSPHEVGGNETAWRP